MSDTRRDTCPADRDLVEDYEADPFNQDGCRRCGAPWEDASHEDVSHADDCLFVEAVCALMRDHPITVEEAAAKIRASTGGIR